MVDIAASLSLTPSSKAFDPAAVAGMEVADIQAFGDILAGQITAGADAANPPAPLPFQSVPFPALSILAGKRQADGKILPDAAAVLPETQAAQPENPGQPILPEAAATPAETAVARVLTVRVPLKAIENSKALEPAPAAAAEEQALPLARAPIKVAAQLVRSLRTPTKDTAGDTAARQSDPVPADADGDIAQGAVVDLGTAQLELPGLPAAAGAVQQTALQPDPASAVSSTGNPAHAIPIALKVIADGKTDAAVPARVTSNRMVPSKAFRSQRSNLEPAISANAQLQQAGLPAQPSILAVPAGRTAIATTTAGPATDQAARPAAAAPIEVVGLGRSAVRPVSLPFVVEAAASPVAIAEPLLPAAPLTSTSTFSSETALDRAAAPVAQMAVEGAADATSAQVVRAIRMQDHQGIVPTMPTAAPDTVPPIATVPHFPRGTAGDRAAGVQGFVGDAAPVAGQDGPKPATLAAVGADRTPAIERLISGPAHPHPSVAADIQTPTQPSVGVAIAATAPTVETPRHDFATLVDRLIEARNASAPHSVTASVHHGEFGQVSLQFLQDGKDLTVSMTSADPEFAVAVQAALPADRSAMNADTQQRGHSNSAGQPQSAASSGHHDNTGQRSAETGNHARDGQQQGRNPRSGPNTSNPARGWSDPDQAQSRNGIFA